MDDKELLKKAIAYASQAHAGQTDKAGQKYILHPLRVMANVETAQEKIVAVLHDTLEDTSTTTEDLRNLGLTEEMIDAVVALSRRPDESYMMFVERTRENDLARRVKIADLRDNMDMSRLGEVTEEDMKRLEKYRKALGRLADDPGND